MEEEKVRERSALAKGKKETGDRRGGRRKKLGEKKNASEGSLTGKKPNHNESYRREETRGMGEEKARTEHARTPKKKKWDRDLTP